MMLTNTAPAAGTSGMFTNTSSNQMACNQPFNHSKDIISFGTAALASRITIATILSILILPTIFLNIVILTAIIKNRNLWRSSHILIGFLAVTDAFVGTISMPLLLSTILMEIYYERSSYDISAYCVLSKGALNSGDLGLGWSFITISLITFERYIAFFAPFWYRKYVQTKAMVKITIFSWLIWAAAVVILVLDTPIEFAIGMVILILVVLVYFLAVPACIRIVHLLMRMESSQIQDTNSRPKIDRKGSITCAIMLLVLILCYTPLILVSVATLARGVSETLLTYLLPWARVMLLTNSFFNPIIYISRNPLIRRSAKNIFKQFLRKEISQPAEAASPVPSVPGMNYGVNNEAVVINTKL